MMVDIVPAARCVQGAAFQQPVEDVGACLLVLVAQQRVDEGVAGRLAVR